MGWWICGNCGEWNKFYHEICVKCNTTYKKSSTDQGNNKSDTKNQKRSNYRPTNAYTIVYMQNGKEMRNIVDALNKNTAVNKFLKALTRIGQNDIVEVLEGEHL